MAPIFGILLMIAGTYTLFEYLGPKGLEHRSWMLDGGFPSFAGLGSQDCRVLLLRLLL